MAQCMAATLPLKMPAIVVLLLFRLSNAKPSDAAASLDAHIDEMQKSKSACSACNLVSKNFDAEPLSSSLVKGWKGFSSTERSKGLKKTLQKRCAALTTMEMMRVSGHGGTFVYSDAMDMKKKGFMEQFKDSTMGPEVWGPVVLLCELLAAAKAPIIVSKIEEWMAAKKGRRLVDFRFDEHFAMCAGGAISVCETTFTDSSKNKKQDGEDEDDDEDDREL